MRRNCRLSCGLCGGAGGEGDEAPLLDGGGSADGAGANGDVAATPNAEETVVNGGGGAMESDGEVGNGQKAENVADSGKGKVEGGEGMEFASRKLKK